MGHLLITSLWINADVGSMLGYCSLLHFESAIGKSVR